MDGDTGGVNLNEARVSKVSTLTVCLDSSCAVATHSVGRKEVSIAITTGSQANGVSCIALELTADKVLGDDATATTIDDHNILNLCTSVELHGAIVHLFHQ